MGNSKQSQEKPKRIKGKFDRTITKNGFYKKMEKDRVYLGKSRRGKMVFLMKKIKKTILPSQFVLTGPTPFPFQNSCKRSELRRARAELV